MDTSLKAADTQQLSFLSPAKVNLFFRILYKRDDGFHEIASLYQAISLFDKLQIKLSDKDVFTTDDPSLALDQTNLVTKALALFRKKTGDFSCFSIHLEKKIPKEAGLGGGSSNAATALWAFCSILQKNVPIEELKKWGAELGSDVPFFFTLGTAYGTSRGEILEEIPSVSSFPLWIAKPNWGLSTAKVYGSCDVSKFPSERRDPVFDLRDFLSGVKKFYNDLELPAFSLSPELKRVKEDLLRLGFSEVILSGSGTAFFCIPPLTGDAFIPKLPGVDFFSVKTLQRNELRWYEL